METVMLRLLLNCITWSWHDYHKHFDRLAIYNTPHEIALINSKLIDSNKSPHTGLFVICKQIIGSTLLHSNYTSKLLTYAQGINVTGANIHYV